MELRHLILILIPLFAVACNSFSVGQDNDATSGIVTIKQIASDPGKYENRVISLQGLVNASPPLLPRSHIWSLNFRDATGWALLYENATRLLCIRTSLDDSSDNELQCNSPITPGLYYRLRGNISTYTSFSYPEGRRVEHTNVKIDIIDGEPLPQTNTT